MCVCVPTRGLDADVVEGVNADVVSLEGEGKAAGADGLELVVVLQVRPAPQPTVDDVGETLAMRDLGNRTITYNVCTLYNYVYRVRTCIITVIVTCIILYV